MRARILALSLVSICYVSTSTAGDVNERYPYRVPDWLWDTARTSYLLSPEDVLTLRSDIAKLAELEKVPDSRAADSLEDDIAKRLSDKFSLRDLAVGSFIVKEPSSGIDLAVQIDPAFNAQSRATIQSAVSRFVKIALDPEVIKKAYERSTLTPTPMPEMFKLKDGKQEMDAIGRPEFTSNYAFYLKQRVRPTDPEHFTAHLRNAMVNSDGEASILVISKYSGNVWWGGGYYNYFSNPIQQVAREGPGRGYFYVRLNSDRFVQPEVGWNDPNFWASKIAHEMLHNLGYWHPDYKDPAERDMNNKGVSWNFAVSYEAAILEKLVSAK